MTDSVISVTFSNSGQVMFPHHSDQVSQMSKVSKIALLRYSVNVFVFVFVYVVVFLLVRSCFLITLIKCLKGQSLKDRSLKAFLSAIQVQWTLSFSVLVFNSGTLPESYQKSQCYLSTQSVTERIVSECQKWLLYLSVTLRISMENTCMVDG